MTPSGMKIDGGMRIELKSEKNRRTINAHLSSNEEELETIE